MTVSELSFFPPHKPTLDERRHILESYGAKGMVLDELLAYNDNRCQPCPAWADASYPLPDEAFVAAWQSYAQRTHTSDAASVLNTCLRQLNFPIRQGMREDPHYRGVVRRGEPVAQCPTASGLALHDPAGVSLHIAQTPAGRIPVIQIRHRLDFEAVLQALLHQNEPIPIPPSMGAVMIAGYNNWDRIEKHQTRWRQTASPWAVWADEFKRLLPQKERYQDSFVIVSSGPYSHVSAEELGLGEDEWLRWSVAIRIAHESAHYATKRLYGQMRNNLQDEIVADAMALVTVTGQFRADWFLRFMGLEKYPAFRPTGRMSVYRGTPPLSDAAFLILQAMLVQAAQRLAVRFPAHTDVDAAALFIITDLATATLEALSGASPHRV